MKLCGFCSPLRENIFSRRDAKDAEEYDLSNMNENEISGIIIDCSYKIHTLLGPGLFESVYEETLCYELQKRNLSFKRQQGIPVIYEDVKMDLGFRADVLVEDKVIIEIKSIDTLHPVHKKQFLKEWEARSHLVS